MRIGFTSILTVIIIIQFICAVFLAVYGIRKKNWLLAVIPAVSFVVFVVVVYAVLMKFITSM